jgi:LysM repeat protein
MNRHGILGTAFLLSCGGLLAACAESPQSSAPAQMMGGPAQGGPAAGTASPGAHSVGGPRKTRYIVVRPGQSLGGIAEAYHVPRQVIIAANHLTTPYSLKTGERLAIPLAARQAGPPPYITKLALSAPAPAHSGHAARRVSAPSRHAKVRLAGPEVIPLDDPAPAQAGPSAANPPATPASSSTTSAR